MATSRRLTAATALAAALAVPTGTAGAAQLSVAGRCFVAGEAVAVTGSGFTAGAPVTLFGAAEGTATADASGAFTTRVRAPATRRVRPRVFALGARDAANPSNVVPLVRFPVVPGLLWANYRRAISGPPRAMTTWRFSGFTPRRAIFGHFVLDGQVRHTHRFGVAHGRCGTLRARARRVPVPAPRAGRWTLQIDQARRYRPGTQPRRRLSFSVTRAIA